MTQPIELIVAEPMPGSYVWRLLETDEQGGNARVIRAAFDPLDSYEVALAAGQGALDHEIRRRHEPAAAHKESDGASGKKTTAKPAGKGRSKATH
ncbi:hypothetical protein QTH91_05620 [Variovorax dokdonensis]|uniref:DUF2188 domain-containing protein n=1 Tax=Variovorax dokdonensis TaxID=344883 RepID=A0ABT7N7N3_9BURK|nr:hypothetical protein [Variovorax dokdonensis]MDM0043951.1 hypothetical protein [Variovorax dokdonensis]